MFYCLISLVNSDYSLTRLTTGVSIVHTLPTLKHAVSLPSLIGRL